MFCTPQEYYRLERVATERSEYFQGIITDLPQSTTRQSLINANMIGELGQRLKGSPFLVCESSLRIKVPATGLLTYPFGSIYNRPIEYDEDDSEFETVTNPIILWEMLAKANEAHVRGFKAINYRQIETLQAYVLVSQNAAHVEVYHRAGARLWQLWEANGLDSEIGIPHIDVVIPLREIYDRVEFPESISPRDHVAPPSDRL
jgi:hypothetical protein